MVSKMAVENYSCGLSVRTDATEIVVYGNTYANRDVLRKLGGRWDARRKLWTFVLGTDLSQLNIQNESCHKEVVVKSKENVAVSKPSWLCNHEGAKIVNASRKSYMCFTCHPGVYGGYMVNGMRYTSD